jgi:hypothetical protein
MSRDANGAGALLGTLYNLVQKAYSWNMRRGVVIAIAVVVTGGCGGGVDHPRVTPPASDLVAFDARPDVGGTGAAQARVTVQQKGPSFLGTVAPTGTKRPESVVWWNDGSWWANMWHARSQDFRIFRFSARARRWVDTKTIVDRRVNTGADALSTGSQLYIATHKRVRDTQPAVSGSASYLFRFSYNKTRHRYTLDAGFPTVINRYRTETLVINQDATGKLWATWQQDGAIYVSTSSNKRTWRQPFRLPFPQAATTVDDISSVVAFSDHVGVMWSNQARGQEGFWFAIHRDGAPDNVWQPPEAVLAGERQADDHMNLKADSRGVVYAAVKTSNIDAKPLSLLLTRGIGGGWASSIYSTAQFCHNRPTLVIDEKRGVAHVFATGPAPPNYTCTSSGGAIYAKSTQLNNISFRAGRGTMVLADTDSPFINSASTSKRNVPSSAGRLVLAANEQTHQYWTLYQK